MVLNDTKIIFRVLPQGQVKDYSLNTVTYGVNSAPYFIQHVLRHISDNNLQDIPDIGILLRHKTYMNDICVGSENYEAVKTSKGDLIDILAIHLHKLL